MTSHSQRYLNTVAAAIFLLGMSVSFAQSSDAAYLAHAAAKSAGAALLFLLITRIHPSAGARRAPRNPEPAA